MKRSARLGIAIGGVAALGAAFALAGGGYSAFQSQSSPIQSPLSTATIQLSLTKSGSSGSLPIGASNLVPGDFVQREVVLKNTGTAPIGTVTLQVTNSTTNALSTDATNGLQVSVQSCPAAWSATPLSDGGFTYSCSATPTNVVASEPIGTLSTPTPLSIPLIPVGGSDALVITRTLPTSAGNSFQNLQDTTTWTFTATQETGSAS